MSYSDEDVVFSDLHKLSVDITNKNIDNINIVMKQGECKNECIGQVFIYNEIRR